MIYDDRVVIKYLYYIIIHNIATNDLRILICFMNL